LSAGFSIVVEFHSKLNDSVWTLLNVYGPCSAEGKADFITWMKNVDIPNDEDWIIMGDFNLYRVLENRNREGANTNDMFIFNSMISHLVLKEIALHGKKYTWSNMQ
jgi:hypothetical protein